MDYHHYRQMENLPMALLDQKQLVQIQNGPVCLTSLTRTLCKAYSKEMQDFSAILMITERLLKIKKPLEGTFLFPNSLPIPRIDRTAPCGAVLSLFR